MDEEKFKKELAESKKKSEEGIVENIKILEKSLSLLEKERDASIKLHRVTEAHPKILKAEYEFQELDEFWDVVKELNRVKNERSILAIDSQISQTRKNLASNKAQLEQMGE